MEQSELDRFARAVNAYPNVLLTKAMEIISYQRRAITTLLRDMDIVTEELKELDPLSENVKAWPQVREYLVEDLVDISSDYEEVDNYVSEIERSCANEHV